MQMLIYDRARYTFAVYKPQITLWEKLTINIVMYRDQWNKDSGIMCKGKEKPMASWIDTPKVSTNLQESSSWSLG